MYRYFSVAAAVLGVVVASSLSPAQVVVRGPHAKRYPIAVYDFCRNSPRPPGAPGREVVAGQVRRDLEFSGIFRILDARALLDKSCEIAGLGDRISHSNQRAAGAEATVTGKINEGPGQLEIEMRLFDNVRERRVLGKEYKASTRYWQRAAHEIANEIMQRFTGDHGNFGSRIAFTSDLTGNKELYSCEFDGSNIQRITNNDAIDVFPAWSFDGERIAFTSFRRGSPFIFSTRRGGRGAVALTGKRGVIHKAAWSPSGRELAIVVIHVGGNSEIYRLSPDGKQAKRLTNYRGIDTSPTWSPDGKRIAFVSDRSGGRPQIFVMGRDGDNPRRLTYNGSYNSDPDWSPKGDRIAFNGIQGGRFQILTIRPDGTNFARLTSGGGNNEGPSWAPNGRQIVFSSNRGGNWDLYVVNDDGTNMRRITSRHGNNQSPDWSPVLFN